MAVHSAATQYTFQFLEERRIHRYYDMHGVAGLRELIQVVQADCDALERLADAIDDGECYSISPDSIRAWWGWG